MKFKTLFFIIFLITILFQCFRTTSFASANINKTNNETDSLFVVLNYNKKEYRIAMRDSAHLFTAVYSPNDANQKYPILFFRTPYSCSPYGENNFKVKLGPIDEYVKEKFIFVFQDVRGKFMSEGQFVNMRPQITNDNGYKIDESTDTYDSIDWLVKNVSNNNGKVGIWGISYPGFYAAAGAINAHPALVASSPQAPIADWYWDDFHHNGALFLPHAFNFLTVFGQERKTLTTKWPPGFKHPTPDGYDFFLNHVGALENVNRKYFKDTISFWNDIAAHPNYDIFWQEKNILPHIKKINTAVLTVGGWFDAEDLYGPLKIYQAIEKNNPDIFNVIVMGPWRHGGWTRTDGTKLGKVFFGDNPPPSDFYQKNIELPFFNYYLKGKEKPDLPEAFMFETGTNEWRRFDKWPPENLKKKKLYFQPNGKLSFMPPIGNSGYDEFISDPSKPVPFTEDIAIGMTREYMTDDQRFASRRTDVLSYQTEVLESDITMAGNLIASLMVSTTGTDADWVVKLIDVYPDDFQYVEQNKNPVKMGGYQQMVRSEVIRGRFRNSFENPEPFKPDEATKVSFELLDVLHTFKKGHRIMIQVQSTWFPLVDRNPQKYIDNIFLAKEEDFIKSTHRVYRSSVHGSFVEVGILQ